MRIILPIVGLVAASCGGAVEPGESTTATPTTSTTTTIVTTTEPPTTTTTTTPPTTTTAPPVQLAPGLLCRDIAVAGYGFAEALAYWVREGMPERMDADGNGLPCETVYAWGQIEAVMGFDGTPYDAPEPPAAAVTIGDIAADTQQRLDDRWNEETDHNEGVLGPFRVTCDDASRAVGKGDVFACAGVPQTEPGFDLDPVGIVFMVLDGAGTTAWISGTDVPDSTPALWDLYDEVGSGLMCRDLVDPEGAAGWFSACCGTPPGNYSHALIYWCMDGMPERMDADGDGIPCETMFPPDVVADVWDGGAF